MSDTPYLDKIELARAYERVEHGREEEVHGYMSTLQRAIAHPALGQLRPASWGLLGNSGLAARELGDASPHDRLVVHSHLEAAAEAIKAGNHSSAIDHLAAARDHAMYSGMGREVPKIMRAHINGLNDDKRERSLLTGQKLPEPGAGKPTGERDLLTGQLLTTAGPRPPRATAADKRRAARVAMRDPFDPG